MCSNSSGKNNHHCCNSPCGRHLTRSAAWRCRCRSVISLHLGRTRRTHQRAALIPAGFNQGFMQDFGWEHEVLHCGDAGNDGSPCGAGCRICSRASAARGGPSPARAVRLPLKGSGGSGGQADPRGGEKANAACCLQPVPMPERNRAPCSPAPPVFFLLLTPAPGSTLLICC